jgi:uncharacterized protein (TIGR02266 family)
LERAPFLKRPENPFSFKRVSPMATFDNQSNHSHVLARLIELIKDIPEEDQRTLLKELEEKYNKGRRRQERKPFFMVVDYSTKDRVYKDYIQNISAGGVFIETQMPFSVGQEVSLSFPLPNYLKYIKILGEVVRTCPQGIGLRFKPSSHDQEEMIQSLLETI